MAVRRAAYGFKRTTMSLSTVLWSSRPPSSCWRAFEQRRLGSCTTSLLSRHSLLLPKRPGLDRESTHHHSATSLTVSPLTRKRDPPILRSVHSPRWAIHTIPADTPIHTHTHTLSTCKSNTVKHRSRHDRTTARLVCSSAVCPVRHYSPRVAASADAFSAGLGGG
jgi:hypothetical protein